MDIYTRIEAAEYLGVSPGAVINYIIKNKLPAFKKGRAWLIWSKDLEEFKQSDWFLTRSPGLPKKYPDDMPRRNLFK